MNYRRYNYTDCYRLLWCFFLCLFLCPIFAFLNDDDSTFLSVVLGIMAFATGLILLMHSPWCYLKISYQLWQLNRYEIPQDVQDDFKAMYPHVTQQQYNLIVAGFKDFFALYMLEKKKYYLPSQAVHQFIKVYARHSIAYQTMWQHFLGYAPNYYTSEQKSPLALTFKMACYLNKIKPVRHLPRLFTVDEQLQHQIKNAKIFDHQVLFSSLSFTLKKEDRYNIWFRQFFKHTSRRSSYSNSDTGSRIDSNWDNDFSSDSSSCDSDSSGGGCD